MQIGFIATPKTPLQESDLRFAAEEGMPHLELIWDDFTPEHAARAKAEKAKLKEFGVHIAAAGFWRRNLIDPDLEARKRTHEELTRYLDYCHEVECPVLITGGGTVLKDDGEACAAEFARAFPPLLEHATKRGVRVCLYGLHGKDLTQPNANWLADLPAYERLWKDFPQVGMKYDAANWMGAGLDPLPPVRHHGDKMYHVHIKEHLYHEGDLASQPAAGMGDVPFPKIMAFLHEHRYAGALSIEPHGPWNKRDDLRVKMLRISKRYMENWIV